jgi:hypothetical protein
MNNFLIKNYNNNVPIMIPFDNINNKKELKIHKILFYPRIEDKILKIILTYVNISSRNVTNTSHIVNFQTILKLSDSNIINSYHKIQGTNNNTFNINFVMDINDNYVEIKNINIDNQIRNFDEEYNYEIRIILNDIEYGNINKHVLTDSLVKFPIIGCRFLKLYLNHLKNQTIEINENNKFFYTGLIAIKKPLNHPIEFDEDDFPLDQLLITDNTELKITDEDNNLINIKDIYIFYSILDIMI